MKAPVLKTSSPFRRMFCEPFVSAWDVWPHFLQENSDRLSGWPAPCGRIGSAPLRRVGRVNKKDGNTRPLRLVGDELAQLQNAERPAFQPVPLAFSNPTPLANVLEAFNRNGAVGAFSQQNYLLGNHMITVAGE